MKLPDKKYTVIYAVILTPLSISILSSKNARKVKQSKAYFTLDLLIDSHSILLRASRPRVHFSLDALRRMLYSPAGDRKNIKNGYSTYEDKCYTDFPTVG